MELPITKPSQVSYADELDFSELLEKMAENEHNGFIRITHSSEEGYILFKEGKKVAASYDRFLKSEAIDKIKSSFEKSDTLIEVFDLKESQMNYLIDLNKVYKLEEKPKSVSRPTETNLEPEIISDSENIFNPKEASYRKSADSLREEMELQYAQSENSDAETKTDSLDEPVTEEVVEETVEEVVPPVETPINETPVEKNIEPEAIIEEKQSEQPPEESSESEKSSGPEEPPAPEELPKEPPEELTIEEKVNEQEVSIPEAEVQGEIQSKVASEMGDTAESVTSTESEEPEILNEAQETTDVTEESSELVEEPEVPMDRLDLMKKYGLRDIDENEVENILDTYKGGFISSDDVEKIELTLMNKIKKSVMGIPKIRGTEVMVFLESSPELIGKIKIITIYEGKGLFSRLRGDSKDIQNLRYQITDITEMEIRKSFREYPQIVDNFDIDIEIHSP